MEKDFARKMRDLQSTEIANGRSDTQTIKYGHHNVKKLKQVLDREAPVFVTGLLR